MISNFNFLKSGQVQDIINRIEELGFVIKNMLQRELIRQEAWNIFYKHEGEPYYEDLIDYMLSGDSVVLLLCHETENPIEKWKKAIGKSDPEVAKVHRRFTDLFSFIHPIRWLVDWGSLN